MVKPLNTYALLAELVKAEAERDAAEATIARITEALSNHPECDRYTVDGPITCRWKNAIASISCALDNYNRNRANEQFESDDD